MHYNEAVFRRQYPVVVFFVQYLAYYRGLQAAWDGITDHKEFWASTVSAHLKLATIAWCNVFGSRKSDMHWTKTPTGNIPKQAREDFTHKVLSTTGLTQEQWETYHQGILAFRDKYVAHMDLQNPFTDPVPPFDPALQVAYAYEEWARDLTKAVIWGQPTLSSLYGGVRGKHLPSCPGNRALDRLSTDPSAQPHDAPPANSPKLSESRRFPDFPGMGTGVFTTVVKTPYTLAPGVGQEVCLRAWRGDT